MCMFKNVCYNQYILILPIILPSCYIKYIFDIQYKVASIIHSSLPLIKDILLNIVISTNNITNSIYIL